MRYNKKILKNGIHEVEITGFDIETAESKELLKTIISLLTSGIEYYFHFSNEDSFFLEDDELVKCRHDVPNQFSSDNYLVPFKIDDEHFDSIGFLPVNNQTYEKILDFWNYFEGMTFFTPKDVSKELFKKSYKIEPKENGVGYLDSNYAESVFNKGHDRDSLVFSYTPTYDDQSLKVILDRIDKENHTRNYSWFNW